MKDDGEDTTAELLKHAPAIVESALDYAELHCNTPQQKIEKSLSIDRSLCFSPVPCEEGLLGQDPRLVEAVVEAVSPRAVSAGFKRVPSSELPSMSPKSSNDIGSKVSPIDEAQDNFVASNNRLAMSARHLGLSGSMPCNHGSRTCLAMALATHRSCRRMGLWRSWYHSSRGPAQCACFCITLCVFRGGGGGSGVDVSLFLSFEHAMS